MGHFFIGCFMFGFVKNNLQKIYNSFTASVHSLFDKDRVDEASFKELELLLISADTGVKTSRSIIDKLKSRSIAKGADLKAALAEQLMELLVAKNLKKGPVHLLIGINGSGKTTLAGKLAYRFAQQGKKVLLVAGDTFRAGAVEQLELWAQKAGVSIMMGNPGQEPAAVIFQACEKFKTEQFDELIIDTAGRLQTKVALMKELEKIKRIVVKQLLDSPIQTLLMIDSMLGQNSLEQAKLFNETTPIDGLVLTKMDGTGKGGIVFAISQSLQIPVSYISYGEHIEDLQEFDAKSYVSQLLER
jgi:fused signal recognition particle receptor